MVEETIDVNALGRHEFKLLASLDSDLQRTQDRLDEILEQLDEEHRRVGKALGLDIDKKLHLEKHQVYKYSLRITKAVSCSVPCFV